MAKTTNGLTAKKVERLTEPGRYPDGNGLHLIITPSGTKNWQWRFYRQGVSKDRQDVHSVEHWLGLGPFHTVSLKDARERARAARLQLLDGIDPIAAKKAAKASAALAAAKALTFEAAAKQYYAQHAPRWRDPKSGQFLSQLKQHVFPTLGALSVADIDTGLVLKVIEPIWSTKTETASRLRRRIETILDWAAVRGFRSADIPNPARWKGHLSEVLPPPDKTKPVQHHAALAYTAVPTFMAELEGRQAIAARALAFTILTASRTGETIGATWDEIDLKEGVWTIPAGRMKAAKEHKVPLADAALEILRALPREAGNDFVFIGQQGGGGLSNMAMLALLKRMDQPVTVHGFRSAFRDWAAERTSFANHILEMALAHTVQGVEAAYRRGDLLDKRRRLMSEWASYCYTKPASGEVVGIREAVR